jgi:hypothetical protein
MLGQIVRRLPVLSHPVRRSSVMACDTTAADERCALRIHPIPPYHNVAHLQRLVTLIP